MPTVLDALEHAKFLISKGRGTEPAKLVLPRVEAQRRRANKEGRTRLIRDLHTTAAYSEWNAEFNRYIEACAGQVQIAEDIMLRLLKQLPSESIARLAEDDHQSG